jgi:hypothetical protein
MLYPQRLQLIKMALGELVVRSGIEVALGAEEVCSPMCGVTAGFTSIARTRGLGQPGGVLDCRSK